MDAIFEMNNIRKDADFANGKITKHSPVVEVFAAMSNGESLDRFGKKADVAVKYIQKLGERAEMGDFSAVAELNTIRRFVIETPIMEEMKLLSIFGTYQNVGYDETIEREITVYAGEKAREQAAGGDVVFPAIAEERYTVPTFTISGGYAVDYRRVALGDMSKENEGMAQVQTTIRNKALLAVVVKVYNAIKAATGVKYQFEGSGLTKAGVDKVLQNVRRNGRPTVIADYALISQFTPWAGYVGSVNNTTITGISEAQMNELAANGALSMYNGALLSEMPNPYDLYAPLVTDSANEKNFQTLLPAGLGFVIPQGVNSPIATWTRGGLTSFTGNNVKNGKIETRFDLEVAVDVAKTQEWKIGTIYDNTIGGLSQ
jgi:hypothetical protein